MGSTDANLYIVVLMEKSNFIIRCGELSSLLSSPHFVMRNVSSYNKFVLEWNMLSYENRLKFKCYLSGYLLERLDSKTLTF